MSMILHHYSEILNSTVRLTHPSFGATIIIDLLQSLDLIHFVRLVLPTLNTNREAHAVGYSYSSDLIH